MVYAIVAVIILILDQASKYWTIIHPELATSPQTLIPHVVELTNIKNTGAAFGLLDSWPAARWIFVVLTIIFSIVIVIVLRKNIVKGKLGRWMLVFVLAGGLGNCIDRIINGYVVDMFHLTFMNFAIFNVADIFITVGGIIFCIYLLFSKEEREEEAAPAPARKAPSRPMPRATERPQRGPDYLTQLKKPVVEARASLEAEERAKQQAAQIPKGDVFDWNTPEIDISSKTPAQKPTAPSAPKAEPNDPFTEFFQTPVRPSVGSKAAATPKAAAPRPAASPKTEIDISKPSGAAPTKKSGDFSLEDILAEFKDK